MSQRPTASTALFQLVLGYMAAQGHDPGALCERAGVEAAALADRDGRLPIEAFGALWREAARVVGSPLFGLEAGVFLASVARGHVLFGVMAACPTLAEAVDVLFRYHGLMTDAVRGTREVRGEVVCLGVEVHAAARIEDVRLELDAIAGLVVTSLRMLVDRELAVEAVVFPYAAPSDPTGHERILGAPVRFGGERLELLFPAAELRRSVLMADADVRVALERVASKRSAELDSGASAATRVGVLVEEAIEQGRQLPAEEAARRLRMSVRGLQEALRGEGTTYREVRQASLQRRATALLQDPRRSLAEIAFLLGFADQSAFTRAYRRWTGQTPGAVRQA